MGTHITGNFGTVFLVQTIFILLFMFPDFSLILWKAIVKQWASTGGKRLLRRNKTTSGKIKKYWEIDLKKFK